TQQISTGSLTIARNLTVMGAGAAGTTGVLEMLGGGNGSNTLSGTVTMLGDNTTIGVDVGQLTLSGIVSGATSLTKVGLGMLSLGGGNTYNGVTNVNAGIVEANNATALGAITAGTLVVAGASLHVNANTFTGEQLTLNGTGFGTLPAGGAQGLLLPRGA